MTKGQALALERLTCQLRASLRPLADADTRAALDMLSNVGSEIRQFVVCQEADMRPGFSDRLVMHKTDSDSVERLVGFLRRT